VVRDSLDAIILQDLEGTILAWNPAAARMYGWSESEALKLNIQSLIPEGLAEEQRKQVQQLSKKKVLKPYQTQRLTKEGERIAVWLTATALLNDKGALYAIATTERQSD
jgi:two-component system CheB/CheR fusion protein